MKSKFNVEDIVEFIAESGVTWGNSNIRFCNEHMLDITHRYIVNNVSSSGKWVWIGGFGEGLNVHRLRKSIWQGKTEGEMKVEDYKEMQDEIRVPRLFTEQEIKDLFERIEKEGVKPLPSKDVVPNPMVGVKPTDIIAEDDVWGMSTNRGARVKVISLYQDSAGTLIVGYRYLKSAALPKGYVAQMSIEHFQRSFPTLLGRRIPKEPTSQPKPQMKRKMKVRRAFGMDKFVFDVRYELCPETDTVYAKVPVYAYEDFEGVARLKKGDVFSSVKGRDIAGWKLIREIANAKLNKLCK